MVDLLGGPEQTPSSPYLTGDEASEVSMGQDVEGDNWGDRVEAQEKAREHPQDHDRYKQQLHFVRSHPSRFIH